ncbi:MAG: molybdate ABC transporter substrate-binding protein [Cypionkella sp.]
MSRRLALASVLIALATPALAENVVVFAAASMKTALDAVAADFSAKTGNTVSISYAGSNQLAKQIIDGAPADIFISAAVNWMDAVEQAGLITDGSRRDLFGNTLVLVANGKDAAAVNITQGFDLAGLLGGNKLAMAMVDSVPAGQYGKAALQSLGVWDKVEASVAQADNVRAALAFVSTGEAPFGIVYATDAVADPRVSVVGHFPADSHPPIVYPAALLKTATDTAGDFFADLSTPEARAIFTAQGFKPLN